MTTAVLAEQQATEPATARRCDWHGCDREAVVALRFRDQLGHVHDCAAHAAELREFCDVAESRPLPCPWGGHRITWVDTPRDLV